MQVPLSWLKEYVDITMPVPVLAERLTLAGLEVESIDYVGVEGAELVWDRDKFVIAHILEVMPHPGADRLVLARVDYGAGEPETLVTGAPNLFPYLNQDISGLNIKSPMVMEGATIYDGHKEGFVKAQLKGRNVRGIMNRHMLCSEKELGISEEHEGIMLLDTGAAPGTPLQDVLGDVIFHLDLTPNLARCQSIIGVAREVAAFSGKQVRYPSIEVVKEGPPVEKAVRVRIEDETLCPRFTGTLIRDVTIGPSPAWMQKRLRMAGMRPISNIVDVTNYVMLEIGQPLHAFDYDLLCSRAKQSGADLPTIIVRAARPGEGMTTLDGEKRVFNEFDLLITDTAGPVGIAGVMGGADTEIHVATRNILLEAANFNFINIRRTAQAHKLPSEAAARFGKGIHPEDALRAANRAAELMRVLGTGVVDQGVIDVYPGKPEPVVATITPAQVEHILGIELDPRQISALLEALQFKCEIVDGVVSATVPDHRTDISTGLVGTADLAEEIARVYGYDRIPETEMSDRLPPVRANKVLEGEERVRDLLATAGLQEIISYRFTTPEAEARLLPEGMAPDDRPYITMANPISQDKTVLRHTLMESMLKAVASNLRHHNRLALFEIGSVYLASEEGDLPEEQLRLCLALAGQREITGWMTGSSEEWLDFYDLKGAVETLTGSMRIKSIRYEPASHPTFQRGRTARLVTADGRYLGVMGQVHPSIVRKFDTPEGIPVAAAELDLKVLLSLGEEGFKIRPVPLYPAVYRDIALVVDEGTPAADIQQLIEQTGGPLLADVRLFDVYKGEQLPAGKKSLAYALAFQAPDKTLTDNDANKQRDKIVKRLEKELGAQLRVW